VIGHGFYSCEGVPSVVSFDQVLCVNVGCGFPGVIAFGVIHPFNKVLQRFCTAMVSVSEDPFHLIFLLSIDQFRRWSGEVRSMGGGFMIGGQQGGVEYIVYSPSGREAQLIGHRGYFFDDREGAIPLRG
jgi:hypothetical protein